MSTAAIGGRKPIGLARWYACLSSAGDWGREAPMTGRPDTQVGRLGVFRADEGCEVAALAGGEAGGAVVFNGYLFDRSELIADLGLPGAETTCAEIAAAAYARWGSEVFDRLDGCYLLAIWDAAAEVLLLGHDALGRHPVFYALEAGRLWFGANVLSVAHAEGVRREPNRLSLALQFLLHWPDAGETFFEHVRRVRPGHFVRVSSDLSWSEHKYWEPMPADDEPFMSADDVHEQFEPALTRAVDRCLALGAQGIMLSGGVDSVTVAALAARQLRDRGASPLVAVSARTGGPLIDEEIMQSRVCEALGMPHIVSTTPEWKDGRDDVSLSLDIMADLPAPTHIWWVGTYTRFYQRTAAQELNVLMTGAGGDNWLGVADSHAADLMRGGRVGELYRFIKSDIVTGGASVKGSLRRLLWAGGLRPHLDSWWARIAPGPKLRYHRRKWHERLPAWLCPDAGLREALIDRLLARRTPPLTAAGGAPRSYYQHSLRSLANPYMHHENETAFHIETWCRLRLLSPYHDRRLVDFFNRIPPHVLVHGDRYKGLLRPVVERHLPHLGLENQRKDYPADLQLRKLRDLRRAIANAGRAAVIRRLADLGVIQTITIGHEIACADTLSFEALARLFTILSAERWLGEHATT